jgi:Rhodopirellula transposase DDE domain
LLHELGYSLQSVRKNREGALHPDRNEQFEYINAKASRFLASKQPVISVDTKKKELVGDFKNAGYRSRVWKLELQQLADDLKLRIHVSHFPPGTSKWNKIEHRLFCHITQNWRGKPLRTLETVIQLIGHTRTSSGLRVMAKLASRKYPTGVAVTNAQMKALALHPSTFRGEWNYELRPRKLAN